VKQKVKDKLINKINKMVVFPGYKEKLNYQPNSEKTVINHKWTSLEEKFR